MLTITLRRADQVVDGHFVVDFPPTAPSNVFGAQCTRYPLLNGCAFLGVGLIEQMATRDCNTRIWKRHSAVAVSTNKKIK